MKQQKTGTDREDSSSHFVVTIVPYKHYGVDRERNDEKQVYEHKKEKEYS